MKKRYAILFIIAALICTSCASSKRKEQTINISGAFALYPLVVQWAEEYKKDHPDVRFNISGGGAGKGMADALAGTVDLGMFSREISPEEIAQGVWWTGLSIDAVLPTISANNPYLGQLQNRGISQTELSDLFINETITNWQQLFANSPSNNITVFTRSDACGAAGTWALYLGGKQEDLKGIGIYGDPALAEAVAKEPYGIAFNNTIYIYNVKTGKKRSGMEVIPIDLNNNGTIDLEENFYTSFDEILNAIAKGNYPSPPARELYFVAKGKPKKQATLDFINWCLTKGQAFVCEAGYVPISQDKIKSYIENLK